MLLEDLRLIHEDKERMEQAIAERLLEKPKNVRWDPAIPCSC